MTFRLCCQVSRTHEGRRCHEAIRAWVQWLLDHNCFCPGQYDRPFDPDSNVTCYITTPGTVDGGINEGSNFKHVLRYTQSERGADTPQHTIGRKLFKYFGAYLVRYCHFGIESSITERLVEKVQSMVVDLRPVLGCTSVYDAKKHLEKLGFHRELPGLCRHGGGGPDNFLKLPMLFKSHGGGVSSEGAGVNMFALLAAASLVGNDHVHCKAASRISQNVLKLMVKSAPVAVTPGNCVPVRSFNDQTCEAETVYCEPEGRPEHFLRPIRDDSFAHSGIFSVCPVDERGWLPEDLASCAAVYEQSKFLSCAYADVPPSKVAGHYQLVPGRYYALYSKAEDKLGTLLVDERGVNVVINDDTGVTWDFKDWHDELRKLGYLILPMIWRSGALVAVNDGANFACLAPDPDSVSRFNFSPEKLCYTAYEEEGAEMISVHPVTVLDNLVRPGTVVWVKPSTKAWKDLSVDFPATELDEVEAAERMVQARLNLPTVPLPQAGKVHVTILQRHADAMRNSELDYRHVVLDPWELCPEPPARDDLKILELVI